MSKFFFRRYPGTLIVDAHLEDHHMMHEYGFVAKMDGWDPITGFNWGSKSNETFHLAYTMLRAVGGVEFALRRYRSFAEKFLEPLTIDQWSMESGFIEYVARRLRCDPIDITTLAELIDPPSDW